MAQVHGTWVEKLGFTKVVEILLKEEIAELATEKKLLHPQQFGF